MPLVALTQVQLDDVFLMARPIPVELRDEFLRAVAAALSACAAFGDGDVHRICANAQQQVLWGTDVRNIDESSDSIRKNKLISEPTRRGRPIDPVLEERADRRRVVVGREKAFTRLRSAAGARLRALRVSEANK